MTLTDSVTEIHRLGRVVELGNGVSSVNFDGDFELRTTKPSFFRRVVGVSEHVERFRDSSLRGLAYAAAAHELARRNIDADGASARNPAYYPNGDVKGGISRRHMVEFIAHYGDACSGVPLVKPLMVDDDSPYIGDRPFSEVGVEGLDRLDRVLKGDSEERGPRVS